MASVVDAFLDDQLAVCMDQLQVGMRRRTIFDCNGWLYQLFKKFRSKVLVVPYESASRRWRPTRTSAYIRATPQATLGNDIE